MVVEYSGAIRDQRPFGFMRVIFRWKGSMFRLIFWDGLVYAIAWIAVYILGKYANPDTYYTICELIRENLSSFPLAFLLGFYVSTVYSRWWDLFNSIPWVSSLADIVTVSVRPKCNTTDSDYPKQREEAQRIAFTILRYVNLSFAMVLRNICTPIHKVVKGRQLVNIGLAREDELKMLFDSHELNMQSGSQNVTSEKRTTIWQWWVPMIWASQLSRKALDLGYIASEHQFVVLLERLNDFKGGCGALVCYDWINIPLPYTQVVSLCVYAYFFLELFGSQQNPQKEGNFVFENLTHHSFQSVPYALILKFFIYYGWLKVAEVIINPMGSNADYDLDFLGIVNGNLQGTTFVCAEFRSEQARAYVEYAYQFNEEFVRPSHINKLYVVPKEEAFQPTHSGYNFGSLLQYALMDVPKIVYHGAVDLLDNDENDSPPPYVDVDNREDTGP